MEKNFKNIVKTIIVVTMKFVNRKRELEKFAELGKVNVVFGRTL